jgi:O-antigen ligase
MRWISPLKEKFATPEFRYLLVVNALVFMFLMSFTVLQPITSLFGGIRVIGAALFATLCVFLMRFKKVPLEAVLFGAFLLWAALTGIIWARSPGQVINTTYLSAQAAFLFWAMACLGVINRSSKPQLIFIIVLNTVFAAFVLGTGGAASALGGGRATGVFSNPNTLALWGFYGTIACCVVFQMSKTKLSRGTVIACAGLCMLSILASGSRKGMLALLIFAAAYLIFWAIEPGSGRATRVMQAFVAFVVGGTLLYLALPFTTVGARLLNAVTTSGLDYQRNLMKEEALTFFNERPIQGLGIGHFELYSITNTYSHSDYLEALATTGAVGFALLFGMYLAICVRVWRAMRVARLMNVVPQVRVFAALMPAFLFLGTGVVHFYSYSSMMAMGTTVAFCWALERAYLRSRGILVPPTQPSEPALRPATVEA